MKERERERSGSSAAASPLLPFPHPMTARKHPTMRLSFPVTAQVMAPPTVPLARVTSRRDKDTAASGARSERSDKALSRVSTVSPSTEPPSFLTAAAIHAQSALAGGSEAVLGLAGNDEGPRLNRVVSFSNRDDQKPVRSATGLTNGSQPLSSPERRSHPLTRQTSRSNASDFVDEPQEMDEPATTTSGRTSPRQPAQAVPKQASQAGSEEVSADDGNEDEDDRRIEDPDEGDVNEEEEDEDEEEDEEDEDEDEDEDDGLQATALHISALDLAGYG